MGGGGVIGSVVDAFSEGLMEEIGTDSALPIATGWRTRKGPPLPSELCPLLVMAVLTQM